jgi:pyridoxine 5-phosphate synthase
MQIENLNKLILASEKCINLGLVVNAGHDLNQKNLPLFIQQVPKVSEVSIGHALVCDSIYEGLEQTVRNYKSILSKHSERL